jgi:hypothetical protein
VGCDVTGVVDKAADENDASELRFSGPGIDSGFIEIKR